MLSRLAPYETPSQGQAAYDRLDPRYDVSADVLTDIIVSLEDSPRPGHQATAANAWLEKAILPGTDASGRRLAAQQAGLLFGEVSDTAGDSAGLSHTAPMHCHLPAFAEGWTEDSRQECKDGITALLRTWSDSLHDDTTGQATIEKGRALELVTILMLGHTGLEGIKARPSFQRQDCSGVPVRHRRQDKRYAWDVTVLSDGTLIDEGEYRLQVKSNFSELRHYHPDIVRVGSMPIFHVPQGNTSRLVDIASDLAGSYRYTYNSAIGQMTDRLLDTLCDTGPVQYHKRSLDAI